MTDGYGGTLCVLRQYSRIARHLNPLQELTLG
jgi:hypothetical protein